MQPPLCVSKGLAPDAEGHAHRGMLKPFCINGYTVCISSPHSLPHTSTAFRLPVLPSAVPVLCEVIYWTKTRV